MKMKHERENKKMRVSERKEQGMEEAVVALVVFRAMTEPGSSAYVTPYMVAY